MDGCSCQNSTLVFHEGKLLIQYDTVVGLFFNLNSITVLPNPNFQCNLYPHPIFQLFHFIIKLKPMCEDNHMTFPKIQFNNIRPLSGLSLEVMARLSPACAVPVR